MKIKVVELNKNGKVEFTKEELENMLNEAFSDGYDRGYNVGRSNNWWSYNGPYLTTTTAGYCDLTGTSVEPGEYKVEVSCNDGDKIAYSKGDGIDIYSYYTSPESTVVK